MDDLVRIVRRGRAKNAAPHVAYGHADAVAAALLPTCCDAEHTRDA
jgi:hypothetical protein